MTPPPAETLQNAPLRGQGKSIHGLQEVPPKGNPTKGNTANEMAELKTRLRKLETAGESHLTSRPTSLRQTSKLQQQASPPVGVLAGEHAAEDVVEGAVQEEH